MLCIHQNMEKCVFKQVYRGDRQMVCLGGTGTVPRHVYSKCSLDAMKAALFIGSKLLVAA